MDEQTEKQVLDQTSAPSGDCIHSFLIRHEYRGEVWWQCEEGCDFVFRENTAAQPQREARGADALIEQCCKLVCPWCGDHFGPLPVRLRLLTDGSGDKLWWHGDDSSGRQCSAAKLQDLKGKFTLAAPKPLDFVQIARKFNGHLGAGMSCVEVSPCLECEQLVHLLKEITQAPKPLTGGIVERIAYAHTVPTNGHTIEYKFDWDAIALELTKPLGEELK